jgi:hypothetical protein
VVVAEPVVVFAVPSAAAVHKDGKQVVETALEAILGLAFTSAAQAKGCIKGAIVGV